MKKFCLALISAGAMSLLIAWGGGGAAANNGGGGGGGMPGAIATHFLVTASSSTTSGTPFNVTVTALDSSNNVVIAFSGTVHFTSSDGQALLPPDSSLTNGMGTFSVVLKTVGNQTVTATDKTNASISGMSNSIDVMKAGSLVITSAPPPNGVVGIKYGGPISFAEKGCNALFLGWQPTATEGSAPYQWSWSAAPGSSIPPGLKDSKETYTCGGSTRCCTTVLSPPLINGSPTAAGTYNVIVTVTDSASPTNKVSAAYTIVINSPDAAAASIPASSQGNMRYKFVDLGTFGGPNSYLPAFYYVLNGETPQALSADGTFAGWADTDVPDPNAPNNCFFDCFVDGAFKWKDGIRTPLSALPGPPGLSASPTWISSNDLIVGFSENGETDPYIEAPAFHGVLWQNNEIVDLKTFEGGYESEASAVNSRGQVVGFASNSTLDPNSMLGLGTQTRAFLWQNGVMKDLETLGGTDALAFAINEQGQIIGQSYTADSGPAPMIGCWPEDAPLAMHSFLWENGKMTDLLTLGGSCTNAYVINNQGQVVGQSNLLGDQESHPFIWDRGTMTDLHTLGGTYGYAVWLNDSGEVVGASTNKGNQLLLAFQWKDGVMTNLGPFSGDVCSVADAVNSSGQVVGGSGISPYALLWPACANLVEHAVLWENDQMIDLNSFVPANSDLTLNEAVFINDSGAIAGFGTLPNGDQHAFLLIPCSPQEFDGCQDAASGAEAAASRSSAIKQSPATVSANSPGLNRAAISKMTLTGRGAMPAFRRRQIAPIE